MTNKTLFTAVEAEQRNARTAINNAGAYMNMLKDAVDELEKSIGIEAPLSLSTDNSITDLMVKTESGEYGIPLAIESEDETLLYGFKIRGANKKFEEHLKLSWQ